MQVWPSGTNGYVGHNGQVPVWTCLWIPRSVVCFQSLNFHSLELCGGLSITRTSGACST